jgi:hypothetical protein
MAVTPTLPSLILGSTALASAHYLGQKSTQCDLALEPASHGSSLALRRRSILPPSLPVEISSKWSPAPKLSELLCRRGSCFGPESMSQTT